MSKTKSVLITGCSSGGIGFHLAKEYHAKGLQVFATARRPDTMDELRDMGIECLELDVTKLGSIRTVRDRVSEITRGKLDILVNNAGRSYSIPFSDQNMDEVRAMFETNVFGVMMVTQEFLNLLIGSGDGLIVNIGSIAAILPMPFGATYAATKGAIHSFGNTLRQELAPFNVRVSTIMTGGVRSNIGREKFDFTSDSLYWPMHDDFLNKRQNRSQVGATPTDVYARSVVAKTLKKNPKAWIWTAHMSWITWMFDTFFPKTFWDFFIPRSFGLDKFKKYVQNGKKTV